MRGVVLPTVVAALAAGAQADTFNDLASFQAATQNLTLINFDVDAAGNTLFGGESLSGRYTSLGVEFPAGNYVLPAAGPVSPPNMWVNDTSPDGTSRFFDADFLAGDVTAVGVHQVLFAGGGGTRLTAYDAAGTVLGTVDGDADINTLDFFGLTTTTPIARIEILFTNTFGWGLDDLYFGQVPAPGAASVLGLGLLLAGRRRR